MKNFLAVALCLVLAGCAPANVPMDKPLVEPQFGMTKQQLLDMMGKPDVIEIYKRNDGSRMEFYIYIRQYPSSQYRLPVCLINNKVVGWGKSYYEDHIRPDDVRIKEFDFKKP